jgi:hypothetical protein
MNAASKGSGGIRKGYRCRDCQPNRSIYPYVSVSPGIAALIDTDYIAPAMTLDAVRDRHRKIAEMDWKGLAQEEFPDLFGPGVSGCGHDMRVPTEHVENILALIISLVNFRSPLVCSAANGIVTMHQSIALRRRTSCTTSVRLLMVRTSVRSSPACLVAPSLHSPWRRISRASRPASLAP